MQHWPQVPNPVAGTVRQVLGNIIVVELDAGQFNDGRPPGDRTRWFPGAWVYPLVALGDLVAC